MTLEVFSGQGITTLVSTLANSTLIILFSEMLKFSKKNIVKDNNDFFLKIPFDDNDENLKTN